MTSISEIAEYLAGREPDKEGDIGYILTAEQRDMVVKSLRENEKLTDEIEHLEAKIEQLRERLYGD